MKTHLVYLLLLWAVSITAYSQQKEGAIWIFGSQMGLDFNHSPVKTILEFNVKNQNGQNMNFLQNRAATICDNNGNLLFQAIGDKGLLVVTNKNQQIMPNGFFVLPTNNSSYYPPQTLIIKKPRSNNFYYFVVMEIHGLNYHLIDIEQDSGRGDVVLKNQILLDTGKVNAMAVLEHSNGKDKWLLCPSVKGNIYYSFLIDSTGIHWNDSVKVGQGNANELYYAGALKSSPDSEWLARADFNEKIELYRFNRNTGLPENKIYTIRFSSQHLPMHAAFAFSPNSQRFYYAEKDTFLVEPTNSSNWQHKDSISFKIHQLDISNIDSTSIAASDVVVYEAPKRSKMQTLYWQASPILYEYPFFCSDAQVGIDGKMYWIPHPSSRYLDVMHCPDNVGLSCMYEDSAIGVPFAGYFPAVERPRNMGESFPVLNQTLFVNAGKLQAIANKPTFCIGDTVHLSAFGAGAERFIWSGDSIAWLHQDTGASTYFVAKYAGNFTFRVRGLSQCSVKDTSITVQIFNIPTATLTTTDTILCETAKLTAVAAHATHYTWYKNDTLLATNPSPYWFIRSGGTYKVKAANAGCSTYASIFIKEQSLSNTVFGSVTACEKYILGKDTISKSGSYAIKVGNEQKGCSLYQLAVTINPNSTTTILQDSVFDTETPYLFQGQSLYESGSYQANLTNQFGCDSLVTLRLTIIENLFIPNILTPNQPNFEVKNYEFFAPIALKIYNRWGKLIYEDSNYRNDWNTENVPAGTYFIYLTTRTGKIHKGWVQVVK